MVVKTVAIAFVLLALTPSKPAAKLPARYVVTPHGLVHRTCVQQAKAGVAVKAAQLPRCRHPHFAFHGPRRAAVTTWERNWISSHWFSSTPVGSMTARFAVPPAPSKNGAILFYFPATQPRSGRLILQPVLQWGPSQVGGGDYWAVSNWFCQYDGHCRFSPLLRVDPGDTLLGTMSSSCTGATCDWAVVTKNETTGATTKLQVTGVTDSFTSHFGGTIESWGVTTCQQYPPTGRVVFEDIAMADRSGAAMTPLWSSFIETINPPCNYGVTFTPATTTITYSPNDPS